MQYDYTYRDLKDRKVKVDKAEAKGYSMILDTFNSDWKVGEEPRGVMVFTDEPRNAPIQPETPIEARITKLEQRVNDLEISSKGV